MSHLEEQLQRDIDRIRDRVREMADLAVRGLEDSVRSLTGGDRKVAYAAILRDSRVDELETVIDNQCVEFMVRHIPVAKNLRFAHSVAKIILELERIGDYSESINRQAILLSRAAYTPDLEPYARLAGVAIEMVRQAVRAFLDEDLELADRTRILDTEANRLYQDIFRSLLGERPQSNEEMATLFALLSVANRFERVADQAVNVCEEVYYLVTGDIVKHQLKRELHILFVSSGNSCRGLMAEGIARTLAGKQFQFFSAGIDLEPPDGKAVEFLAKRGIDVSDRQAQTLADVGDLSRFKAVVAIGAEAAKAMPKLGYRTILVEWQVPNPCESTEEGHSADEAYTAAFDELVDRISELVRGLHGTIESLQPGGRNHA
jgi:phosphate transport system protein